MRAQDAGPEVALGGAAGSTREQPKFSTLLGGARCRCGACGDLFNVVSTFDAHRVGGYDARRCLATDDRVARGWLRNDAGFWITSRMPPGRLDRARRSGDRHEPATWGRVAA
jgi:hypothetical protein